VSRPPLSSAQRRAVDADFADALVMAGAGSGKTRVLSERFVHLVKGGHVDLRRLAALTFTEKAAAQMRTRIAGIFRDLAQEAQPDTPREERQAADVWRTDVEFAPISTIHAFCARLLRQHAIEAGVDPAFVVLDAAEAALLKEDAAARAESLLAEECPDLVGVFAMISAGDPREELLGLLARLRGAGRDPATIKWKVGVSDLLAALAAVEEPLAAYAEVGDELEEARRPNHAEAIQAVHTVLAAAHVEDDLSPFAAAQAQARVDDLKGPRRAVYSKPRAALSRALGEVVAALLDLWGERVFLPQLRAILVRYDDVYRRLKAERSALDFTDLELCTRDLLRRAQEIGQPLDLAPRGLLVDEFQDTNPLQAEILSHLRGQAPQFSVGDPKQSIYRFRRADVSVILAEDERVGRASVFPMNASYRSSKQLLAGINALAGALFADGAAGVVYEPLEAASPFATSPDPVVAFTLVDAGDGVAIAEGRPLEAAWIARRIRALVDEKTPRLKTRPDDAGEVTSACAAHVAFGDIAILFRAASDVPLYEAALEAEGIPYLTQRGKGYYQAEEITDLVYVLRTIHNPEDRHALACTATGPAMAATDDEVLRWFAKPANATKGEGAWARMRAEAREGGRHAETVRTLEALRREAVGGSLATTVERALVELGLYEHALLCRAGDRRAANLRKAVELARRLDRGGRRGLADLLRHLATLRDRAMGESEAPIGGDEDDVVRLTTIHSAKGLEYPVVFLADVGRQPPSDKDALRFDGGDGVAARIRDPLEGTGLKPGGLAAIAEHETSANREEALRVLYVAMTRAEERLILSSAIVGATKAGAPKRLQGWGRQLWDVLNLPLEPGRVDVMLPVPDGARDPKEGGAPGEEARVRVEVVDASAEIGAPPPPVVRPEVGEITADVRAEARALWSAAAETVAPLGATRYVVSVSELLTFAESPQAYYTERVVRGGARAAAAAAWDTPEAGRREEAQAGWDETSERHDGLDRAALGRAVHAVIEHLGASGTIDGNVLEQAVLAEGGGEAFATAAREMVERFLACPTGRRLTAALAGGEDVRREVALHARIRFPGGHTVGGFDALLVKGSIDLWLPGPDGVWIVDHKTNRAGARYRTPEDLARHYTWQLRLYALAVERVLGQDVAGARLLLLDPGWGPTAVEVDVDVGGDALEEARHLCQAFAVAELEGRYPADWKALA